MFEKLKRNRKKKRELRKYKEKITKNFKDLKHLRKLTKEQEKEVQDFYQGMIGQKIPLYSHVYFYSRTGVFNKAYVPTNIYACEILPKANDHSLLKAYGDKNMCDLLFPNKNIAHTILKNMNGF